MDLFRDDYKGHMICTHASGPESGPWVGSFSVWSVDEAGEYSCVSQSSPSDAYHSKKFADRVAATEAKRRIDSLLAADDLRLRLRVSERTFPIDPVFSPSVND